MSAQVRPGYKLTEVGVIPEDWDVTTIGQVVHDFRGGASLKPSEFSSAGVRVLPKGGVGYGGLLKVAEDEWQFCSHLYADKHVNNQVDNNYTIIVLRDLVPSGPSIGLAVRISDSNSYVLAQGVYGFKVSSQKLEQGYIIQLSNTSPYRKLMNSIMVGSTQVHITNTAYKLAQIPLPPLSEQHAIAAALSDMDALISGLAQLIAKKRDIKETAMQQLLTGEHRLPGFTGEWEVKRLGDECELITKGTTPTSIGRYFVARGINFVKIESIAKGGRIIPEMLAAIDERTHQLLGRSQISEGDILFSIAGALGRTAIVQSDLVPANTNQALAIIRLKSGSCLYRPFLLKYLSSPKISNHIAAISVQAAQANLSLEDIRSFQIPSPCANEQNAIATILSDMESELASLEIRRDKARQLKQGMMQELLTGRIRLL